MLMTASCNEMVGSFESAVVPQTPNESNTSEFDSLSGISKTDLNDDPVCDLSASEGHSQYLDFHRVTGRAALRYG